MAEEHKRGNFIPAPGPLREDFHEVFKPQIKEEITDEPSDAKKTQSEPTEGLGKSVKTEVKEELPALLQNGRIYVEDSIVIEESFMDDDYDINNLRKKKKIKVEDKEETLSPKPAVAQTVLMVKQEPPLASDDDDCVCLGVCQPEVKTELVDLEVDNDSTVPNSPENPSEDIISNTETISNLLEGVKDTLAAEINKSSTTHLINQSTTVKPTESIKKEIISPPSKRQKVSPSSDLVVKTEPDDKLECQPSPVRKSVENSKLHEVKSEPSKSPQKDSVRKPTPTLLPFLNCNYKINVEELRKLLGWFNWKDIKSIEKLDEVQKTEKYFASRDVTPSTQSVFNSKKNKLKNLTNENVPSEVFCVNTAPSEVSNNLVQQLFCQETSHRFSKNNSPSQSKLVNSETNFFSNSNNKFSSCSERQKDVSVDKSYNLSTPNPIPQIEYPPTQALTKRTFTLFDNNTQPTKLSEFVSSQAPAKPSSYSFDANKGLDKSSAVPSLETIIPALAVPQESLSRAISSFDALEKQSPQPSNDSTYSSSENSAVANAAAANDAVTENNQSLINQNNTSFSTLRLSTDELREVLRKASNITPETNGENGILGKRPYVQAESDLLDPRKGPKRINLHEYKKKKGISNTGSGGSSTQFLSGHVPLSSQISSQTLSSREHTVRNLPGIDQSPNSSEVDNFSPNRETPNSTFLNSTNSVSTQNVPAPEVMVNNSVHPQYSYPSSMFSNPFSTVLPAYFMVQPHASIPTYPVLAQNLNSTIHYSVPHMTTQSQAYIPGLHNPIVSNSHGLQTNMGQPFHSNFELDQPDSTDKTLVDASRQSTQSSPTQLTVQKRFKSLAAHLTLNSKLGVEYFNQQELMLFILSWSWHQMTDCYRDNKTPFFGNKLVKVTKTYQHGKAHYNTYLPCLLLELFYRAFSLVVPNRLYTHCKFSSWKKGTVSCYFSESENKGEIVENGLVFLRICEQDITTKMLGHVVCIKRGNHGTSKVYFSTAYERYPSTDLKRVEALGLGPAQWFLDQHMALRKLPGFPLAKQILSPNLYSARCYTLSQVDVRLRKTADEIKSNRAADVNRTPSLTLICSSPDVSTVQKVVKLVTFLKEKVLLLFKTEEALVEAGLALLQQSCSLWTVTTADRKRHLPKELTDRDLFDHGGPLSTIHCTLNDASCLLALTSHCYFEDLKSHLSKYTCILMEANCCTEPESLVPLLYGIPDLILVGDPQVQCQVLSRKLAECFYGWSLFCRLRTTCFE